MPKGSNLLILATVIGDFQKGQIVPGYALAGCNPDHLVSNGLAAWTNDHETVEVSVDALATAVPNASNDLIKAHAALKADHNEALDQIDKLHAKCLDLEKKHGALTKELGVKTEEVQAVKSERDKLAVEVVELKKQLDAKPAPDANKKAEVK